MVTTSFGALGRKNPEKKGLATGGLVCSIIGLVLCLALYIAWKGVVYMSKDLKGKELGVGITQQKMGYILQGL